MTNESENKRKNASISNETNYAIFLTERMDAFIKNRGNCRKYSDFINAIELIQIITINFNLESTHILAVNHAFDLHILANKGLALKIAKQIKNKFICIIIKISLTPKFMLPILLGRDNIGNYY